LKNKLIAVSALIRVPNGITAIADSMAGYFVASGENISVNFLEIFLLAVISFSVYSFGIIVNDLHDIKIDRQKRPERPLASNKVSIGEAYVLCGLFILISCFSGYYLGKTVFFFVLALIIMVLLYDVIFKDNLYIAPLCMGACRFLNFLLGASFVSGQFYNLNVAGIGFALLVYVTLLTFASRYENDKRIRTKLFASIFLWVPFFYLIGYLSEVFVGISGFLFMFSFVAYLVWIYIKYVKVGKIEPYRSAIKYLVIGIVFFDAMITSGTQGLSYGLIILAILLPAVFLSKRFSVN